MHETKEVIKAPDKELLVMMDSVSLDASKLQLYAISKICGGLKPIWCHYRNIWVKFKGAWTK